MIAIRIVNAVQTPAAITNEQQRFIGKSILYHLFMAITDPDAFQRKLISDNLEYRSGLALLLADNLYSAQDSSGGILANGCFIPIGATISNRMPFGMGQVLACIEPLEYAALLNYYGTAFIAPLKLLDVFARDIHRVITSAIRQYTWSDVADYEMVMAINQLGLMDLGADNEIVERFDQYRGQGIDMANQPIHIPNDGQQATPSELDGRPSRLRPPRTRPAPSFMQRGDVPGSSGARRNPSRSKDETQVETPREIPKVLQSHYSDTAGVIGAFARDVAHNAFDIHHQVPIVLDFTRSFSWGVNPIRGQHVFVVTSVNVSYTEPYTETLQQLEKVMDAALLHAGLGDGTAMLSLVAIVPATANFTVIDRLLDRGFTVKRIEEAYGDRLPVTLRMSDERPNHLQLCVAGRTNINHVVEAGVLDNPEVLHKVADYFDAALYHEQQHDESFSMEDVFNAEATMYLAIPNRLRHMSYLSSQSGYTIV